MAATTKPKHWHVEVCLRPGQEAIEAALLTALVADTLHEQGAIDTVPAGCPILRDNDTLQPGDAITLLVVAPGL